MVPISTLLGMLVSMSISNHIFTQLSVQAAAAQAATQAGVAGVTAGVALSRPGFFGTLLLTPLRFIHYPFYLISGQQKLDQVYKRTVEAFEAYLTTVSGPWLQTGDVQITASSEFITKLKQSHEALPTQPLPNPEIPAFSLCNLQTPDAN